MGVAAVPPIVYVAVATTLLFALAEVAKAFSVSLAETVSGEPYIDEPVVGVVPSVV